MRNALWFIKYAVFWVAVVFLLTYGASSVLDDYYTPADEEDISIPMADSTVKVVLEGGGHGSAVHIGNGYFVTASHVTVGSEEVTLVGSDNKSLEVELTGQVLWNNSDYDVSLIYAPLTMFVESSTLDCRVPTIGEEVVLKGNPLNIEYASSFGYIASGEMEVKDTWKSVVTVDAALAGGMSGGGLFDKDGDLIGINVGAPLAPLVGGRFPSLTGFGYSVPSSVICHLLAKQ